MPETHWLTEDEERAWRSLQFMQMQISAGLARDLASSTDLTYPEYLVLVGLTDSATGRLRLYELGDILGWEKSRLSHQVARMAARGLLARDACSDDRRGCFVVLTDEGREAIAAAAPVHLASVRRLFFDHLTTAEAVALGVFCATVLEQVSTATP